MLTVLSMTWCAVIVVLHIILRRNIRLCHHPLELIVLYLRSMVEDHIGIGKQIVLPQKGGLVSRKAQVFYVQIAMPHLRCVSKELYPFWIDMLTVLSMTVGAAIGILHPSVGETVEMYRHPVKLVVRA